MKDPVTVDRHKAEMLDSLRSTWAIGADVSAAKNRDLIKALTEDYISDLNERDMADLIRDLNDTEMAAIARFLFNEFMPGTLNDSGLQMVSNEQAASNAIFKIFWAQYDIERENYKARYVKACADGRDLDMERV